MFMTRGPLTGPLDGVQEPLIFTSPVHAYHTGYVVQQGLSHIGDA